jgi:pyridoxamine 5'-phosphate oxidase
MMTDPAQIRRAYARDHLDEDTIAATWLEQLRRWFDAAAADPAVIEPNAMALATVDAQGRPSVRNVLAKEFSERGVVFYTNYASAKAADLQVNPFAAAAFGWLAHERQVRLSGPVRKVPREQSETYFATRPRESQLSAWASEQSQVVASRAELEAALQQMAQRFGDRPIPAPPGWGGYLIEPVAVEFWQGRPGRLHDRIRFRRAGAGEEWVRERLAP